MISTLVALLVGLTGPASFPDAFPPELQQPPGYLLQPAGLRELAPADMAGRPSAFPFRPGERLTYQVRYFGVEVGFGVIEVARFVEVGGRHFAHLVATARTNDFWSRLFRVDDRMEAFVDLDTGRVERSRTRTLHGSSELREEVVYDWETHFVHVRRVKVHHRTVLDLAFDFGPSVYDVFDAFYALRRVPFRDDREVELPVYASRKIHGFRVRCTGRREVSAAALGPAPVRVLELRPYDTVDGQPRAVGDGRVYVLDEDSRVPVLVDGWFRWTSFIHIGGVAAELVQWDRGRSDWPAPKAAPWTPPPLAPSSTQGRPRWSPPPAVVAARARQRTKAYQHWERLEVREVSAPR